MLPAEAAERHEPDKCETHVPFACPKCEDRASESDNGRVLFLTSASPMLWHKRPRACKTTSEEIKMKLLCHLDFDLVASTDTNICFLRWATSVSET